MIRRLFSYFDQYRKDLLGSAVCVVFECVFELVIPLIMAGIIDVGVIRRDRGYILRQSALMILCALVSVVLGVGYARMAARAGQGFGARLRDAEYRKVQGFSFASLDRFSDASLITRLTSDVTILQNAVCNGIRPMVRGPVMMVLALVLSISLSPRLAVVFMIAMPVLALGLFFILRALGPIYGGMQRALDRVNSIVQENLTAIRTVKAFAKGGDECRKFAAVNEEYRSQSERAFHFATLNMPYFQLIMYATIVSLLWFGGNFIHQGSMQVGELTGFLSYVLQILNSLMMISNVFLMLSRSTTSARRVFEVLDEPATIVDNGRPDARVTRGEIEFDHVGFRYDPKAPEYVLSDVNLHFHAGETVGIVGGTGSAKTSLVQLLPRLYDVSAGSLRIDGRDVREYPLGHLRDAVAMVLQNNTLFSGTIRDNLRWGNPGATQQELDWACHIACADEFLSRMPEGYDTDLGQGGVNVSGGQKQRLCIARALLKHPRVLIFDDSLSAVDTATEGVIRRRMTEGLRDATKLIITQRVGDIADADRIVILDDGHVSAFGTHEELLAGSPIYRDIWETQRKGAAV